MEKDLNKTDSVDVSIILVNYKAAPITCDAVRSIIEFSKGFSYEIIVVDNASDDGSAEYLRNNLGDKIILIASEENLGFGKGNNLGAKAAKGDFLFLLNNDTLLIDNSVKVLLDAMHAYKSIGICGGNLFDAEMQPAHSFGDFPTYPLLKKRNYSFLTKFFRSKTEGRKDFNYSEEPKKVGYITGADLMISKRLFDKVGGFDNDFFMYSEEVELTYRVKLSGYDAVSIPQAKIIHLEGASEAYGHDFNVRRFEMIMTGFYCMFKKIYGTAITKKMYRNYRSVYFIRYVLLLDKSYKARIKINKKCYEKTFALSRKDYRYLNEQTDK